MSEAERVPQREPARAQPDRESLQREELSLESALAGAPHELGHLGLPSDDGSSDEASDADAATKELPPADPVQGDSGSLEGEVHRIAAAGTADAGGALPHLDTIQAAFGRHDIRSIQAHTGPTAAEAATAMGATAYATGNHVAFAGTPDLHTAAHEAAHVVQQRAGVSLMGGVGQLGDVYEQHANEVADAVVAGRSAEAILDRSPTGGGVGEPVQMKASLNGYLRMRMAMNEGEWNKFKESLLGKEKEEEDEDEVDAEAMINLFGDTEDEEEAAAEPQQETKDDEDAQVPSPGEGTSMSARVRRWFGKKDTQSNGKPETESDTAPQLEPVPEPAVDPREAMKAQLAEVERMYQKTSELLGTDGKRAPSEADRVKVGLRIAELNRQIADHRAQRAVQVKDMLLHGRSVDQYNALIVQAMRGNWGSGKLKKKLEAEREVHFDNYQKSRAQIQYTDMKISSLQDNIAELEDAIAISKGEKTSEEDSATDQSTMFSRLEGELSMEPLLFAINTASPGAPFPYKTALSQLTDFLDAADRLSPACPHKPAEWSRAVQSIKGGIKESKPGYDTRFKDKLKVEVYGVPTSVGQVRAAVLDIYRHISESFMQQGASAESGGASTSSP